MRLIELEAAIKTACDAVEHYPSDWAVIEIKKEVFRGR